MSARVLVALALVLAGVPTVRAAAAGCGAVGTPTTTIFLPNITKTLGGPGGWYTPFIVQNVGVAPTNLEVSFFRFSDGSLVTCRQVPSLAPGTSFADVPNNDVDLPDDTQFAVVVKSFGAAVVSVVNEHQGAGDRAEALSYVGLSSGATRLYLPYVVKQLGGWLSTFVVQNLGAANANVTITLTSYDGARTVTLLRQIAPGRSAAIDPSVEPTIAAATEYAGVIAADQPVAAIVNAQNDAPGTVAPMGLSYNAVALPQSVPTYVPAVARNADGVGRTTRLLIENAGSGDATPSVVLRAASGGQITVTAPAPIHPGASWSYDPRFGPDGRTPCPPAGSPTCPAEGTLSAVVQGGAFAVVAASLTPTSAMGYIGQGTTGNRAYLPNVTRRLGGPNGWTTPIVIESAGATLVTLRWYRFADGVLMVRQPIPGLSSGASVTVDPRNVAGLADETQYAVVVDASGGNVAAIVTELNFSGGDGDMAYEGFAATVNAFPVATAMSLAPATLSVTVGGTAQLTASVKDQFDNAMAGPVTWTVAPPTLGGVSATGLFTAGQAAGVGTITATAGTASATANVTVALPTTQTVGGVTFRTTTTNTANVFIESSITVADGTKVSANIDADITKVQTDLGTAFAARPQVYVLASTQSSTTFSQTYMGMDATTAARYAGVGGYFDTLSLQRVVVNWYNISCCLPVSTPRHELTHMLIQQIAGPYTRVPAWLNEGSARLEDLTVPGSGWKSNQQQYNAVSAAAQTPSLLLPLSELVSQETWNLRTGAVLLFQYSESAEAVRELRQDVGIAGTVQILTLMSSGQPFDAAFQTVAHRTTADFYAAFPARVKATAVSPGVVTATDTFVGSGVSFMAYGFAPGAALTLTIAGSAYPGSQSYAKTADAYGTYQSYLDSRWAPGSYTFTFTDGTGRSANSTVVKASSFQSGVALTSLDDLEMPLLLPEPMILGE